MKRKALALTAAVGLALFMQASAAQAGGGHGWHGGHHGHCNGGGSGWYGHGYYGHSNNDAAIVAATLFGTAAVINAFSPRYYGPPPAPAYYPPPPPVYYPAPPPVPYYPRPHYYRPY